MMKRTSIYWSASHTAPDLQSVTNNVHNREDINLTVEYDDLKLSMRNLSNLGN